METATDLLETPPANTGPSGRGPRVALFTDSDVFAGTERHIFDLARGLRDCGVQVRVACPAPSPLAERSEAAGVPVIAIQKGGMIDFRAVGKLRALLASGELDLVHAHNGRTALSSALATALAGAGSCILTQHFLEPGRLTRGGVQRVLSTAAHGWTGSRMSRFIAISQAVRDAMIARKDAPPDKITVVPNGIATPERASLVQVRAELGVDSNAPLVVCVARLEPEKDVPTLIAAMSRVAAANPAARCVVVGEGSQHPALARQILEAGLTGVVTLAGFRQDSLSFINAADVFVLPSLAEPFGLVLLEAMALGKPVISTDVGGPLEIVVHEKTGLLVPASAPDALAAAILRLLGAPSEGAAMGREGLRRFEECFTCARMARAILSVYQQALAAAHL